MGDSSQDPDLVHFQAISWCSQLLLSPDTVITPTNSRQYKSSTEDALFAETLNTDDTISACLSFYNRPKPGTPHLEAIYMLLTLGYRVNGFPGVAHGGILATVMDEVFGTLLAVNKSLGTIATGGDVMTAYLNVSYLKPVLTPGTVLVTGLIKEVVGRKCFVEATIKNENAEVLSTAEALFIGTEKIEIKENL